MNNSFSLFVCREHDVCRAKHEYLLELKLEQHAVQKDMWIRTASYSSLSFPDSAQEFAVLKPSLPFYELLPYLRVVQAVTTLCWVKPIFSYDFVISWPDLPSLGALCRIPTKPPLYGRPRRMSLCMVGQRISLKIFYGPSFLESSCCTQIGRLKGTLWPPKKFLKRQGSEEGTKIETPASATTDFQEAIYFPMSMLFFMHQQDAITYIMECYATRASKRNLMHSARLPLLGSCSVHSELSCPSLASQ